MPEVIGFELSGELPAGATATDLVLTVTQMLRKEGVVNKFVEYFGPGVSRHEGGRPGHDRQHGAGIRRHDGLLSRSTSRRSTICASPAAREAEVQLVERYTKEQQSVPHRRRPAAYIHKALTLDLGTIEPCLAGPKRPQDRVAARRP